jgi:AcrR family transcriptional regulator
MNDLSHTQHATSAARERVLHVAEQLFSERGYVAVTLKDIADALKIKVASLYYHVENKEALFVEVMERGLNRHRAGLQQAIDDAPPDLRSRLRAAIRWIMAQPLPDFGRMMGADMPALKPENAEMLSLRAFQAFMEPIIAVLAEAKNAGEVVAYSPELLAGSLFFICGGIRQIPEQVVIGPRMLMAEHMVDVFLDGIRPR